MEIFMRNYTTRATAQYTKAETLDVGLRDYMLMVYNYMAAALLVTGLSAFVTLNFAPITSLMFNFTNYGQITGMSGFGMLVMIAPIGIAWYLGYGRFKI
jgi:FtsH-binding integral membrane protein